MNRRQFLLGAGGAAAGWMMPGTLEARPHRRPNVVFVLADQWRAQATGCAGDRNAQTPTLDRLARESVSFTRAVSGCPVCCPYRGALFTGQYPLTHGVVVNDVPLRDNGHMLAQEFARAGYRTAYIGKWHSYGSPDGHYGRRSAYVPREARMGFDYWKAFECSHDYNHSPYFEGDDRTVRYWEGYDAVAQSRDAARYIAEHSRGERPFLLVVSWGPPHDPYNTAPAAYRELYAGRGISLRPNVPEDRQASARTSLRGYYAHIAALDDCLKTVWDAVERCGAADDTLFVFTSDHGDMHESQSMHTKIVPWDESIRVPFLLRYPALLGRKRRESSFPLDAPDLMPTLLGLCGLPVPATVQGVDASPFVRGERRAPRNAAALLTVPIAFGVLRTEGLPEYRGLRTARHTYVRSIRGPWLLYDNEADPYQMDNLVGRAEHRALQADLEGRLQHRLNAIGDRFLPGEAYAREFGVAHYGEVSGR